MCLSCFLTITVVLSIHSFCRGVAIDWKSQIYLYKCKFLSSKRCLLRKDISTYPEKLDCLFSVKSEQLKCRRNTLNPSDRDRLYMVDESKICC